MARLFLTVKPLPSVDRIFSLYEHITEAFPAKENRAYLRDLFGKIHPAPPQVVTARLGALALLPSLLQTAKIDVTGFVLSRNEHGRPFCYSERGAVGFDFNVSHSKHHIACALLIGSHRVGVDLEEPLTPERAEPLIRRYGTDGERTLLVGLSPEDAAFEFTRIWTVREALAKQEGQGRPLLYDASAIPPHLQVLSGRLRDTGTFLSLCFPVAVRADDIRISEDSLSITRI